MLSIQVCVCCLLLLLTAEPLGAFVAHTAARRSTSHKRGRKAGALKMLDFLPMSPIGQLTEAAGNYIDSSGAHIGLAATEHLSAGFKGGSVGVIGTLIAIQIKKQEVRKQNECCYCEGSGHLTCGQCLGAGEMAMFSVGSGSSATIGCPTCGGKTFITCVNCRGDGRLIPLFLDKTSARDPEDEFEEIGMA